MIEVFGKRADSSDEHYQSYFVSVDGTRSISKDASILVKNNRFFVNVRNTDFAKLITQQTLGQLAGDIGRISLPTIYPTHIKDLTFQPQIVQSEKDAWRFSSRMRFMFRIALWKRVCSMSEYRATIVDIVNSGYDPGIKVVENSPDNYYPTPDFALEYNELTGGELIGDEVSKWQRLIENILVLADNQIANQVRGESILASFNFPDEVKVPCEQYLLYFVEFLKDLGVEAVGDLQHDSGKVLFSVTPSSGKEALEKIREALELYLQFPKMNTANNAVMIASDPRIQQMAANVQHLQGQLMLASAINQAKEATIAQHELQIHTLKRIISGDILQDSLNSVRTDAENNRDSEDLAGGLVSIKKYQGKGFELDLPEMYRRLKLYFKQK